MIAIIDYGAGNLFSVKNALDFLAEKSVITAECEEIRCADAMILPGVGAFPDAMRMLNEQGLAEVIKEEAQKKPLLGICLGMQMLFENLYEDGLSKGLNFQKGEVKKLSQTFLNITIPNIGWGRVKFNNSKINEFIGKFNNFYFSHSYYVETNKEDYLAFIENTSIPAATLTNNIVGVQFHPEKSSVSGELFIKWFLEEFNDF